MQVLRSEPGAGRIIYDNVCNLIQPILTRFTELRESGSWLEFRIARAEIMSENGVSVSIALIEGGGV